MGCSVTIEKVEKVVQENGEQDQANKTLSYYERFDINSYWYFPFKLFGHVHTWPMTISFNNNVSAYISPNIYQKYSKNGYKFLEESFHIEG